MQVRLLNQGDTGLTIEFGDIIDRQTAARVTFFDGLLREELAAGRLEGVIEAVPTYRSLTVIFDPLRLPRQRLCKALMSLLERQGDSESIQGRLWRLPVCYGHDYGPDLESVARECGLTTEEVVALHSGRIYTVYMIGFLPGFPYLGDLDPALQMPRRKDPRVRVPKGAVAIAGLQTAVYPWQSPGGWQLLGRCPLPLFDPQRSQPALLAQGDNVQFSPVTAAVFARLSDEASDGSLDLESFAAVGGGHA